MMAKPPLPPVRLPRGSGSSNSQPPTSVLLATVQPAGVVVPSNVWVEVPVVATVYPGCVAGGGVDRHG